MSRYPGYHTVKDAVIALGISRDIVNRLIKDGLFNTKVVGDQLRLLPDSEIAEAKKFLKKPQIEQLRIIRKDTTLVLAETAGRLIGVSRYQIKRLRKKGRFPQPIGRAASAAKVYSAREIVEVAKANGMWYDERLASALGINSDRNKQSGHPCVKQLQ